MTDWPVVEFGEFLKPNRRPYTLGPTEDADLVGMRLYGGGPFHRERKSAVRIRKKSHFVIRKDDIIYNKLFAWKGTFGIVPEELDEMFVSDKFPTYELDESSVDRSYLRWYFRYPQVWEQARTMSTGTAAMSKLTLNPPRFLELTLPCPPIEVQRRIVARIERLAAKVEETEGLRDWSEALQDGLLDSVVTDFAFSEEEWRRIEDVTVPEKGSVRSGPFGSQLHHSEFVDNGVMAIGTRDVRTNCFRPESGWFITEEKFKGFRRYQTFPGDLLVTIVGASIGRFCVVPEDIPVAFTTKHIMAVTLDRERLIPEFASYMLNYNSRCRESVFSQTAGSAQPSLNATKVKSTVVPVPPLGRQKAVLKELKELEESMDQLRVVRRKRSGGLDALLPSILDKAFTGEL